MPSDGKNKRRRELLLQLRRILDSVNQEQPWEWDKSLSSPPKKKNICKDVPLQRNIPVKDTKSLLLRGSVIYKCECIRRNGLQDRCMMSDCLGKPECLTKFYPTCAPGQKALSKFTDHGNVDSALKKLIAADKARDSALTNYCKLVGPEVNNVDIERLPPEFITPQSSLSTSPSPKNPRMQHKHQRMYNHQQNSKLQQPYPSMQGAQQLREEPIHQQPHPSMQGAHQLRQEPIHHQRYPSMQGAQQLHQEPIYQQPKSYSHAQEHQQQHQHYFYPQNFGYPTPFMNNKPTYPSHQEHQMSQQYQYQMPTQFVQQYPHTYPHPPSNLPYMQNNFLPY